MNLPAIINSIPCPVLSFTEQCIRGYYLYYDTLRQLIKHTSKPLIRLIQALFSPLSLDLIFSITAPIRARCSSTMEASRNATNKASDTSGWTEVPAEQTRPLQPKEATFLILEPYRSLESHPVGSRTQDRPCRQTPWESFPPRVRTLRFDLQAPPSRFLPFLLGWGPSGTKPRCYAPVWRKGAFGGVPLSIASELSESSDEDCLVRDLAGLQKIWLRLKYYAMMSLDA